MSIRIMLPKASAYVKSYDGQNKSMHFLIQDDDSLEKYNSIRIKSKIKDNLTASLSTPKIFWKPK